MAAKAAKAARAHAWLAGVAALAAVVSTVPSGPGAAPDVAAPATMSGRLAAEATSCAPVPAECGTVRVPLFWSDPGGPKTTVAYALVRHRDGTVPTAGTLVPNPGGPGGPAIANAQLYTDRLHGLLSDHDLLLIDPRGTGLSDPINCGVSVLPPTRDEFVRAVEACGQSLGHRARAYTSAATADDFDAVRARLGLDEIDLLGESYGTYLMAVYAQRHPRHLRSIVLSSAYPLDFDMWARHNARAAHRAIQLVCARSAGSCDGRQTLDQLGQLAKRLRAHPIPYQVDGQSRVLDDTALAGITYAAGTDLGQVPAIVRAALGGNTAPLVAAAQAILPFSGSAAAAGGDLALTAAVLCNDYPTLWDREAPTSVRLRQFAARRSELPAGPYRPFTARAWTSAIPDRGNSCIRWPDRHGPVQRTSGPFADVPVLVLSGDLDPNTPTAEGRLAARQFRHARVIEVPNVAHVPEATNDCAASILMDFIHTRRVGDTSCLAHIPPVPVP